MRAGRRRDAARDNIVVEARAIGGAAPRDDGSNLGGIGGGLVWGWGLARRESESGVSAVRPGLGPSCLQLAAIALLAGIPPSSRQPWRDRLDGPVAFKGALRQRHHSGRVEKGEVNAQDRRRRGLRSARRLERRLHQPIPRGRCPVQRPGDARRRVAWPTWAVPARTDLFGAYGIGLAIGFFGYFVVLLILSVLFHYAEMGSWTAGGGSRSPGSSPAKIWDRHLDGSGSGSGAG